MPYTYRIVGGGPTPKLTAIRPAVNVVLSAVIPDIPFFAGRLHLIDGLSAEGDVLSIQYDLEQRDFYSPGEFIAYLNSEFKELYGLQSIFYMAGDLLMYGNYERFESAAIELQTYLVLAGTEGPATGMQLKQDVIALRMLLVNQEGELLEQDLSQQSFPTFAAFTNHLNEVVRPNLGLNGVFEYYLQRQIIYKNLERFTDESAIEWDLGVFDPIFDEIFN